MSAAERDTPSGDHLVGRLTDLLGDADPVPPSVVEAARSSLGWLDLDAALARLVDDSLQATTTARGGGARLLTFETADVIIDVEVSEVGTQLRIIGQVAPAQLARVRADQPGGGTEVITDALGRFTIDALAPGRTRFVCTPADGTPPVHTEWTLL